MCFRLILRWLLHLVAVLGIGSLLPLFCSDSGYVMGCGWPTVISSS